MAEQDRDQLTEEATPRKKEQSREKGEVARSRDVSAVAAIGGGLAALWLCWSMMSVGLVNATTSVLGRLDSGKKISLAAETFVETLLIAVAPFAVTVLLFGIIAEVAQVGWKPSAKPLVPDFSKLNPVTRLKSLLFSSSTAIELAKSLVKIAAVGGVAVKILLSEMTSSGRLTGLSGAELMARLGSLCVRLTLGVGAVLVIIAILDVLIERHRHRLKLRMSKQQVKDEHKEMEGDPWLKGKIRERQQRMMRRRMLEDLRSADVVVTNPTHYAVGLRYKMGSDPAPVIVAIGAAELATRIRKRARGLGIPVASNPPLARGLFAKGKIGAPIPVEFFRATAALLAWVYQMGGRAA